MKIDRAASDARGLGSFSLSVRLMGVCLYVAWIEVIYSSEAFVASERFGHDAAVAIFPISTLGLALGLSLMAAWTGRLGTLFSGRALTYAAGMAGALCTLGACVPGYLPADWMFYACAFGTGLCTSVVAMRCATVMVDMDSRTAIIALAAVQLVAVFVTAFALFAGARAGVFGAIAVLCLLLPGAAVLLCLDDGSVPYDHAATANVLPRGYWRGVVAMALLGMGTCSVRGFFPNFMTGEEFAVALWATMCLALVAMVAIMVWSNSVARSAPYGAICYRLLLAVTAGAAALPLTGLGSMPAGVVATVLFMVTLLVAWAVLFRISFKTGASVLAVFGFGFAAVSAGCDLGFVLGDRLGQCGLSGTAMTVLSVAGVLACMAGALALLRTSDLEALMEPVSAGDEELFAPAADAGAAPGVCGKSQSPSGGQAARDAGDQDERTPFKRRCDGIALEYGLSSREAEVLYLMAKSNDAKAIAEALFVSYNTARTHIRNIYAKMDVHSRHEFFDVVNDARWRD